MARQLSVELVGDSSKLTKTFQSAGDEATKLGKTFDAADGKTKELGAGFDNAAEQIDGSERKFRGLGDTVNGTSDIVANFKDGNLVGMTMGFADLAGGITDFVVPTVRSLWALIAANPMLAAAAAVIAVGVALYEAYQHSETFRNAVQAAFDWIKGAVHDVVGAFDAVGSGIGAAFTSGVAVAKSMINGLISAVEDGLNFIMTPYRSAAGFLGHIPGVGSTIPDFLKHDIKLPRLAAGGIVTAPTVALIGEAGPEAVVPLSGAGAATGPTIIQLVVDRRVLTEVVHSGLLDKKARTGSLALA